MIKCPTCEGRGMQDLTVKEWGKPETSTPIPCTTCKAIGVVTQEKVQQLEDEKALWCTCGNPSEEVDFWSDGEHPNCSKHCYTCKDCNKIVQVG